MQSRTLMGVAVLALAALPAVFTGSTATTTPAGVPSLESPMSQLLAEDALTGNLFWPPAICQQVAIKARKASQYEAKADFWLAIGKCINDGNGFGCCVSDAWSERQEALELAQDQYQARIALCALLGNGGYDPDIDPQDFSATVDNIFFPLVPGRTLIYQKQTSEGLEQVEYSILNETIDIEGVTCRVVSDIVTLDNEVVEDTVDWFSQKFNGEVWYFGEIAKNYEDGLLDNLDGSWRFGKDDAKPGVVMQAMPTAGQVYRQEFLLNEAEDIGKVIATNQTVTIGLGTYTGCVQIEDTTPLEPDALEHKFYAPGIGVVLEVDLVSGETLELIQIIGP